MLALLVVAVLMTFSAILAMPADMEELKSRQQFNATISRDSIINRAQDWVNRAIPYSQSAYTDGYRQDCSGYVSMAWASSQPGHTTYDMQNICTRISRNDMRAGDAILDPQNHVLLFHYWVDSDSFYQYAEIDWGRVATHNVVSYSYFANNGYFPCRFNSVSASDVYSDAVKYEQLQQK